MCSSDLWSGWRIEPGAMLLTVAGGRSVFQKAERLREQIDAGEVKANETAAAATESSQRQKTDDGDDIPF